ncbi:hypothetical protein [Turicimonas muris]|uniref:hypothetical protein n=1 Tax=Turicimonas muris TaxID=1796652 RepID=UPI0024952ED6|nr:hypothetical protein [Turicimonas muris]
MLLENSFLALFVRPAPGNIGGGSSFFGNNLILTHLPFFPISQLRKHQFFNKLSYCAPSFSAGNTTSQRLKRILGGNNFDLLLNSCLLRAMNGKEELPVRVHPGTPSKLSDSKFNRQFVCHFGSFFVERRVIFHFFKPISLLASILKTLRLVKSVIARNLWLGFKNYQSFLKTL